MILFPENDLPAVSDIFCFQVPAIQFDGPGALVHEEL